MGTALLGSWAPPAAATQVRVENRLLPPLSQRDGVRHWLGTDSLGRDILFRLAVGARISLLIGASAVIIGGTVGTTLGIQGANASFSCDLTTLTCQKSS